MPRPRSATRRRVATLVLLPLVGVAGMAACGPEDAAVTPSECAAGGPFTEAACGRVLSAICERHGDRTACEGAPAWDLGDTFPIRCAWADVVTFDDPSACTGARSTGRCVATVYVGEGGLSCLEACVEEEQGAEGLGWSASRQRAELVRVLDRGDGCWGGPIDETTVVDLPAEAKTYGSCAADLPPPPDLCACGPAACAALRGPRVRPVTSRSVDPS